MDCEEAQRLLDQHMQPGTRDPVRTRLGFHLAMCVRCRAYRERRDGSAEQLLVTLLATPIAGAPVDLPRAHDRVRAVPLRLVLRSAAVLVAVMLLLVVGRTAATVYRIQQNVRAMVVPTAPPVGSGILRRLTPTAVGLSVARMGRTPTPPLRVIVVTPTGAPAPAPTLPLPTAAPTTPPEPPTPESGDAVTLLLIGSDLRLDEQGPSRADSVMLVRIEPQQQRVALLSLTRDLMADIPGYGYARINAANTWGGPELERQTISNLFQVPIDGYVAINFAGFIEMVDALGGITVMVNKEIYQPGWELHFTPGPTHMDGLTALRYSRIREPDSDYERIKRQQTVLLSIATRMREQLSIWNLQRLEELTTAMQAYVQTDLPVERMVGLAWALRDVPFENVQRYSVEGGMVSTGVVPGDYYAQVPNPGVIEDLRGKLLGGSGP